MAVAAGARCSGLEIPSTRKSQEATKGSEAWGGTLRTPVPVRGSAPSVRPAAARGTDRPPPRSRQRASRSPGPFLSHLSRLPEALGLRELPHCFFFLRSSRVGFLPGRL